MKMKSVIACLAAFFSAMFVFCLYCSFRWEKVELDLHNEFVNKVERLRKIKKVILLYNHMEERSYPLKDGYCLDPSGTEYQKKFCPHQCFYTDDKSVLDYAHAVIFSARNLETKNKNPVGLPTTRYSNQSWVLLNLESPLYPIRDYNGNIVNNDLYMPAFEGLFNMTMSYRHDADIRIPYGRVLNKIQKHKDTYENTFNISELYSQKTNLVAWISSNCFMERSNRSLLVAQLQQYVQVDIFGDCGPYQCSPPMSQADPCHDLKSCYEQIGPEYKFYLAFENALCEDYVTEKFFYALEFGMVPIVYGKVNYSDIAIPGSFIDVVDFRSVKELAMYLKYLDANPEMYLNFFNWRQHSFVTRTFHLHIAWCSLCSKLFEIEKHWSILNRAYRKVEASANKSSKLATSWFSVVQQSGSGSRVVVPSKTLQSLWPDVALSSGVCDRAPDFVTNTTLKLEAPVRKGPVRRYIDFMEDL